MSMVPSINLQLASGGDAGDMPGSRTCSREEAVAGHENPLESSREDFL